MRFDFERRFRRGNAVARVRAQKLRAYFVEAETQAAQPLAQNLIRGTSLLVGVGPSINQRSHGLVSGRVADRNLVVIGGGTALNACEAHSILSGLIKMYACEIGHAVRGNVLRGVS